MPVLASEDFSFYLENKPGAFFFLGSGKIENDTMVILKFILFMKFMIFIHFNGFLEFLMIFGILFEFLKILLNLEFLGFFELNF